MANQTAGPAVCISFVVGGVCAMLSSFIYAEFSTELPVAGSSFTYVLASLGQFPAFLVTANMVRTLWTNPTTPVRTCGSSLSSCLPDHLRVPCRLVPCMCVLGLMVPCSCSLPQSLRLRAWRADHGVRAVDCCHRAWLVRCASTAFLGACATTDVWHWVLLCAAGKGEDKDSRMRHPLAPCH